MHNVCWRQKKISFTKKTFCRLSNFILISQIFSLISKSKNSQNRVSKRAWLVNGHYMQIYQQIVPSFKLVPDRRWLVDFWRVIRLSGHLKLQTTWFVQSEQSVSVFYQLNYCNKSDERKLFLNFLISLKITETIYEIHTSSIALSSG